MSIEHVIYMALAIAIAICPIVFIGISIHHMIVYGDNEAALIASVLGAIVIYGLLYAIYRGVLCGVVWF